MMTFNTSHNQNHDLCIQSAENQALIDNLKELKEFLINHTSCFFTHFLQHFGFGTKKSGIFKPICSSEGGLLSFTLAEIFWIWDFALYTHTLLTFKFFIFFAWAYTASLLIKRYFTVPLVSLMFFTVEKFFIQGTLKIVICNIKLSP